MSEYAAIAVTIALVMAVAAGMLLVAHLIGPVVKRGPVKDSPYESGMPPVGNTQKRFHIRFYVVAMLFLLFDVELVFVYPWALAFFAAATEGSTIAVDNGITVGAGFLLAGMGMFFALLLFGLLYEWKKGALQWD